MTQSCFGACLINGTSLFCHVCDKHDGDRFQKHVSCREWRFIQALVCFLSATYMDAYSAHAAICKSLKSYNPRKTAHNSSAAVTQKWSVCASLSLVSGSQDSYIILCLPPRQRKWAKSEVISLSSPETVVLVVIDRHVGFTAKWQFRKTPLSPTFYLGEIPGINAATTAVCISPPALAHDPSIQEMQFYRMCSFMRWKIPRIISLA